MLYFSDEFCLGGYIVMFQEKIDRIVSCWQFYVVFHSLCQHDSLLLTFKYLFTFHVSHPGHAVHGGIWRCGADDLGWKGHRFILRRPGDFFLRSSGSKWPTSSTRLLHKYLSREGRLHAFSSNVWRKWHLVERFFCELSKTEKHLSSSSLPIETSLAVGLAAIQAVSVLRNHIHNSAPSSHRRTTPLRIYFK